MAPFLALPLSGPVRRQKSVGRAQKGGQRGGIDALGGRNDFINQACLGEVWPLD